MHTKYSPERCAAQGDLQKARMVLHQQRDSVALAQAERAEQVRTWLERASSARYVIVSPLPAMMRAGLSGARAA